MIQPISFQEPGNVIYKPIVFERWAPVILDGVDPTQYEISSFGRARNRDGVILKANPINSGYLVYRFYHQKEYQEENNVGRYKHKLAHRLVKETFDPVENMQELTVNHDNMDKHDNWEENLSWMSQYDNNMEKVKMMHQYGENIYNAKLNIDQLRIVKDMLAQGYKYREIVDAVGLEQTPNNRDLIGNIKRGITYQRELALL